MSGLSELERLDIIKTYLKDVLEDWEPEPFEPKGTTRGKILRAWRLAAFYPVDGEPHPFGILKIDPGVPSRYILVKP